jgi:hypothetical protein
MPDPGEIPGADNASPLISVVEGAAGSGVPEATCRSATERLGVADLINIWIEFGERGGVIDGNRRISRDWEWI